MSEEIRYWVMDPTGNITILTETPVPAEMQPEVASELMKLEPEAEQVGFLSGLPVSGTAEQRTEADSSTGPAEPALSLRMAGGEFCGNASMCAGVYAVMREQELRNGEAVVSLRVSGAKGLVQVKVRRRLTGRNADGMDEGGIDADGGDSDGTGMYQGTVSMPQPVSVEELRLPLKESQNADESAEEISVPAVRFPGIVHLIIEESSPAAGRIREKAESLCRPWCGALQAEALGLMFLQVEEPAARDGASESLPVSGALTPLVYVPAAGTLFWESSCASGTTAVGAYLKQKPGSASGGAALKQPGGTLTVEWGPEGGLSLSGTVRPLCRRTVMLSLPDSVGRRRA